MSNNEIIVLLMIAVFGEPSLKEQWQVNAAMALENKGMIKQQVMTKYVITEKGCCYVKHINSLELPVPSWRMP